MGNEAEILNSIGNTPLIELCHVVPDGCSRLLVKLESHNPTDSMKDRMARALVAGAVSRGALVPNGTVQPAWVPVIPLPRLLVVQV